MIIDAFPFFNELDVLEIRLKELWNVVDWFVLVEANKTQCLELKPFYFEENIERFKPYLSKIANVKVLQYPPQQYVWAMEHFQRNKVWEGIKRIPNLSINDIVMVSDCDEIPSAFSVNEAKSLLENKNFVSFPLLNCAFKLDLEVEGNPWIGTVMTRVKELEFLSPQDIRDDKDKFDRVHDSSFAGWHFSYMGGKEQVYKKFLSCIEPYDKSVIPSFEEFSQEYDRKVKDGGSFLFSDKKDDSVSLKKIEDFSLPVCVGYSEDYTHLRI